MTTGVPSERATPRLLAPIVLYGPRGEVVREVERDEVRDLTRAWFKGIFHGLWDPFRGRGPA